MGRNIYFTDKELSMVREYIEQATEILSDGKMTCKQVEIDMENGLGSALRKLYKGRDSETLYQKYKTIRG